MNVRELRLQKGWSQEQLAQLTGLSVRTIQRIEQGHSPGLESLKALAAVFDVQISDLNTNNENTVNTTDWRNQPFIVSVRSCLLKYADFDGYASRAEYWWFVLFIILVCSALTVIHPVAASLGLIFFMVPLLAAGARRLHDTHRSGWWQLFALVPFGGILVWILMAQPTR